jgi:hypothetical protein
VARAGLAAAAAAAHPVELRPPRRRDEVSLQELRPPAAGHQQQHQGTQTQDQALQQPLLQRRGSCHRVVLAA